MKKSNRERHRYVGGFQGKLVMRREIDGERYQFIKKIKWNWGSHSIS